MNVTRLMAVAFIATLGFCFTNASALTFTGTKYSDPLPNTSTTSPSGAIVCDTGYELLYYAKTWDKQDTADNRELGGTAVKSVQTIQSLEKSKMFLGNGQFYCQPKRDKYVHVANGGADLQVDPGESVSQGLYNYGSTFSIAGGMAREDHLGKAWPFYRNGCDAPKGVSVQGGDTTRMKMANGSTQLMTRPGIIFATQVDQAGRPFHMNLSIGSDTNLGELWLDNGTADPSWKLTVAKVAGTGDMENVRDMVAWPRTFKASDGTVSSRFVLVIALASGPLNNQHGRVVLVEPGATTPVIGEVALNFWPGQIAVNTKTEVAYVLQPDLAPFGISTINLNSISVTGSEVWPVVPGHPLSIAIDTHSNKLFVGEFAAVAYPRTDFDYIYAKDLTNNQWLRDNTGKLVKGQAGYQPEFIAIGNVGWSDPWNSSNFIFVTNAGKKTVNSTVEVGDFGMNIIHEDSLTTVMKVKTEQSPLGLCFTQ